MTESKRKSVISELINIPLEASKDLSKDIPGWIRPIVRISIYLLSLISLILLSPVLIVIRIFSRYRSNAFQNLRKELEQKWYTDSSLVALNELRAVFSKIKEHAQTLMFKGITLEPYGKFNFYHYLQVTEMLYHWELQHENYMEAKAVCDHVLDTSDHENSNGHKPFEGWIVKKSVIINIQEGNLAAQEYLLKFVDVENENSPIKDYLYKLRQNPKE